MISFLISELWISVSFVLTKREWFKAWGEIVRPSTYVDGLTISPHALNHSLLVRTNETDIQSSDIKNEIMGLLSEGTVSAANDNVETSLLEAA